MKRKQRKMVPLVSLTFFTAVYLTTEAAKSNTCRSNAAMLPTIPGLPGKDDFPRTTTDPPAATAPVPPPTLVQLHLHLWEKMFSVSLGTLDHMRASGTLMNHCETHRGVQMGAATVIVVVHGSLPHYLKQPVTTLK